MLDAEDLLKAKLYDLYKIYFELQTEYYEIKRQIVYLESNLKLFHSGKKYKNYKKHNPNQLNIFSINSKEDLRK